MLRQYFLDPPCVSLYRFSGQRKISLELCKFASPYWYRADVSQFQCCINIMSRLRLWSRPSHLLALFISMFIVATLQLQFFIIVPALCQGITGSLPSPETLLFPKSIKFQRLKKIYSKPSPLWFTLVSVVHHYHPKSSQILFLFFCRASCVSYLRSFESLVAKLPLYTFISSILFFGFRVELHKVSFPYLCPSRGSRSLNPCISSDSRFHSLLNVSRPGSGLNGGRELPLSRIFKP